MDTAVAASKELRRIESQIASKQLEIRGVSAERWPRIDLVAQYGMLARFNNYDEFFRKFQRNNGEIGMSFQLPLTIGPGIGSRMAQSRTDAAHLRVELANARNRLAADTQQSYRDVKKAETAAEVARLDLEVAREQLSVNLAQMQEGRLAFRRSGGGPHCRKSEVDRVLRRSVRSGKSPLERAAPDRAVFQLHLRWTVRSSPSDV